MKTGKSGFTTCFDRQAGEVSKVSAHGMFSDFVFQTTTYAVRGEAYGSSKMTTYNVRGEASKGLRTHKQTRGVKAGRFATKKLKLKSFCI